MVDASAIRFFIFVLLVSFVRNVHRLHENTRDLCGARTGSIDIEDSRVGFPEHQGRNELPVAICVRLDRIVESGDSRR